MLLNVTPDAPLVFTESNMKLPITVSNKSNVQVTFKLQSTVPNRFNLRPRCGTLMPRDSVKVHVELCKNVQISKLGRDRIMVICMPTPLTEIDQSTTSAFWRQNIIYNSRVEKHQLNCYQLGENEKLPQELRSEKQPPADQQSRKSSLLSKSMMKSKPFK